MVRNCPSFTNVPVALRKEPRLAEWIRGISFMGGSTQIGNTTPVSEFNIWSDPEAADIVLCIDTPKWRVGLNITRQVGINEDDIKRLNEGGDVARTYGRLSVFCASAFSRIMASRSLLFTIHAHFSSSLRQTSSLFGCTCAGRAQQWTDRWNDRVRSAEPHVNQAREHHGEG